MICKCVFGILFEERLKWSLGVLFIRHGEVKTFAERARKCGFANPTYANNADQDAHRLYFLHFLVGDFDDKNNNFATFEYDKIWT